MMVKKQKILTRTILLVSFVSLFTDIASEMLYPVMPVYLRSIGFSVMLIGILEGVAEATAGLSKGYFGQLSDKNQKRVPFIRTGYIMSAFSKPLMAFFTFPLWVFIIRTLDRFGKGVRTSARDAMLSDETTPEHKGKVFGFHRSMDTLGAAIGPIFALIFLFFYPEKYFWLFFIAFLPGLVAIALTFLLKDKAPPSPAYPLTRSSAPISFFSYLRYWKKAGRVYRLLIIGLLAFTLFNSSDAFLLLALKEQKFTDSQMIGFYIFFNLIYALFSYPAGVLADKIGLKRMLIMGFLIFSAVYFFMGYATGVLAFGILFLCYGIYAASTEGISKALLSNLAEQEHVATAIGFYNSLSSIFTLLASSIAGLIWFAFGAKIMFMISGMGVFIVVCYLLIVFRYKGLQH